MVLNPVSFEPLERGYPGPVLGMDEAGRGCLAGPVSVGYAIFPPSSFLEPPSSDLTMVRDSKLLSAAKREQLVLPIRQRALCSGVVMASSRKIDALGINPGIEWCMIQALHRVLGQGILPSAVLIDGRYALHTLRNRFPDLRVECMVKGDARVFTIAAASILAKTYRDRRMKRFSNYFPEYGFERHAGYGTEFHRLRIQEFGPSPIHRTSFKIL